MKCPHKVAIFFSSLETPEPTGAKGWCYGEAADNSFFICSCYPARLKVCGCCNPVSLNYKLSNLQGLENLPRARMMLNFYSKSPECQIKVHSLTVLTQRQAQQGHKKLKSALMGILQVLLCNVNISAKLKSKIHLIHRSNFGIQSPIQNKQKKKKLPQSYF